MTRRRWVGAVVTAAAAASVICVGASALAASGSAPGNYRGPARPAPAVTTTHGSASQTNYRGPARSSAPAHTASAPNSNRPA
jgi:hypothetical protein